MVEMLPEDYVKKLKKDKIILLSFLFVILVIGLITIVFALIKWVEVSKLADWQVVSDGWLIKGYEKGKALRRLISILLAGVLLFISSVFNLLIFGLDEVNRKTINNTKPYNRQDQNVATCPYCGNIIKQGQIKCSYCGVDLVADIIYDKKKNKYKRNCTKKKITLKSKE